jgi:hypothetical protein
LEEYVSILVIPRVIKPKKNTAGLWKLEKCVYLAVRKEKVELKKLICLSTKYLLKPIRGVRYESEEIK